MKSPTDDISDNEEDCIIFQYMLDNNLFNKLQAMGFSQDDLEAILRVLAAVVVLTQPDGNGAQLAEVLKSNALSGEDLSNERKYDYSVIKSRINMA